MGLDAHGLRGETVTSKPSPVSIAKQHFDSPKKTIGDLAIFDGQPAFAEALHVGRPNIGSRRNLDERISDILDRRWLTNSGRYVQEFERRIAELVGVKHCIAMCNATIALEIVIRALDMKDEVIIPSFTFIATAHALQWQGIDPVFCDVDPRTHTLDPKRVEEMITSKTTGILGVHTWGRACDVDALSQIAKRRGLRLIFDAAHAFGCTYQGKMIGGFGDAEVFSFHATKFLNSLEGGAVVTNNGDLAQKIRLMKNFGFTVQDRTESLGTNGKMSEFSAAMGLTNLESMDEFVAVNRRNYQQYQAELADLRGVSLQLYDDGEKNNFQYVVAEIDERETAIARDQLLEILNAENVLARRYFYPGCHRMEPYCSSSAITSPLLPETERLADRVLVLPTGTAVGPEEIKTISEIIRLVVSNAAPVRDMLSRRTKDRSKVNEL